MCVKTNNLTSLNFAGRISHHTEHLASKCVCCPVPRPPERIAWISMQTEETHSRRIRSGEFWTFPGLGALKASEDFRTFSLIVIQISLIMWTHNFHAQFMLCASMCWMKEKKQRWICILYDFSTSASHHGKHAHYICTFSSLLLWCEAPEFTIYGYYVM